jgi:hypothetical protein
MTAALRIIPQLFTMISRGVAAYSTLRSALGDVVEVRSLLGHAMNVASGAFITKSLAPQIAAKAPAYRDFLNSASSLSTSSIAPATAISQLLAVLNVNNGASLNYATLSSGQVAPIAVTQVKLPSVDSLANNSNGVASTTTVYVFAIREDGKVYQDQIDPTVQRRIAYVNSTGTLYTSEPTTAPSIAGIITKALGAVQSVRNAGQNPPAILNAFLSQAIHISSAMQSTVLVFDTDATPTQPLHDEILASVQFANSDSTFPTAARNSIDHDKWTTGVSRDASWIL